VNDAHRLCPWADVLYSSDTGWWHHYNGVPEFQGQKYGIAPLKPMPTWGVTVLGNSGAYGLSDNPEALMNGRNSGYAAVNLAKHFGATRVLLLGYDMGTQRGRAHFFGEHPERIRALSPFDTFIAVFESMVAPAAACGLEIINCTPGSALTVFPMRPLREALAA